MKYFLSVISLLFISISYQVIHAKRISETKCQEYKDLVSVNHTEIVCARWNFPGPNCFKTTKTFECNHFTGLIVGGQETKTGEFPHMAAIGYKVNGGVAFKCGGSLISERFVITVAHCITGEGVRPSIVRLGEQNLNPSFDDGANHVDYEIAEIIVHEKYNLNTKENDIALLKLDKDVKFTNHTRPACLQQINIPKNSHLVKEVVATGWGKISTFSGTSETLLKVTLKTWSNQKCFEDMEDEIRADEVYPTQICAGGQRNKDTCQGDSGGPIQTGHSDAPCVYNIVGLTSYGTFKCGSELPGIYTRVTPFIPWIESKVWP